MLLGAAITASVALNVQILTVTSTLRLTATTALVLGPHFLSSSTGHWFNEPEKMNKYDVSASALNTYFSASKTLKEKIFLKFLKLTLKMASFRNLKNFP